jgi:hypothetical protein
VREQNGSVGLRFSRNTRGSRRRRRGTWRREVEDKKQNEKRMLQTLCITTSVL